MEIIVIAQGKDDPPQLANIKTPLVDLTLNESMTFCLIEGGMRSGEHSVIIVTQDDQGSVCLQTSLDKLLTAASGMATIAESRWGWKRPEGHFTLMPPTRAQQKILLEAIQKELEEWDDDEQLEGGS